MAQTVFNPRKQPRLLRPIVPVGENIASAAILVLLIGLVGWAMGQKNNYDPADRDIAIELLQQGSENLTLYTPPLKRWHETATAGTSTTPLAIDPFPTLLLDQQWQATNRVRTFTADNLYEKINGEAPKFLKQGFRAMYYLVLKSTVDGSELAIELYDQGDIGGSMGVFSEHQSANSQVEQQGPVMFFRTSIGIIGRKDQYFFRAAGDSDSANIRQKSAQLAIAFAQLPGTSESADTASDEPVALRLIKNLFDIAPELAGFQNQNVFQYDFAENFWFGRISDNEGERVFVHQAESSAAAAALFQQLFEEQTYEYEVLTEEADSALLYHDFLKNYFALGYRGQFVFGIENSTDRDEAAAILQRFKEGLDLLNEE